jgi:leucyl aminopeptidase
VIDIATLTGACVVALGGVRSGLFATDDQLAQQLQAAGEAALDPCWRLPMDDEYAEGLKTNFADVANVAGRAAGAVVAAKFLHRFTQNYPWAHLDIAGTAWRGGSAKGATGRPVGLLLEFLLAQEGAAAPAAKAVAGPAAKPARGRAKAAAA